MSTTRPLYSAATGHGLPHFHRQPAAAPVAASYAHGHDHTHGHAHAHAHSHVHAHAHGLLDALATPWPADPNVDHGSYAGPSPAQYLHDHPAGDDGSAPLHPPTAPPAWPPIHHLRPAALPAWQPPTPDQQPPCSARPPASYPTVAVHHPYPQPPPPNDLHPTTPALPIIQPDHPAHSDQLVGPPSSASWPIPPPYLDHASHGYANVVTTAWPEQTTHTTSSTAATMAPHMYQRPPQDNAQPPPLYPHQPSHPDSQPSQPIHLYPHLRPHDSAQQWAAYPMQPELRLYANHHAPLDPFDTASIQERLLLLPPSLPPQPPSPKKKTAKVPSSFVERQEKMKVSKRRGPLQEKQREKTHTMRKTKRICVRCRFYKSGCDEGDPCEKCYKITGHARSFREPCYREHLEDTSLIRRCNGREHQEEAEFLAYDWVHDSQLLEMEIIWNLPGYGPIANAPPMHITFRPYSPKRGTLDVAASVWTNKDGEVKSVHQPAYAIYDTANLVPTFERYFSNLQPAIEEWIFSRIRQDEVAEYTYREVVRMRSVQGSKALDLAMRLQCLSVVSQGYGSVWSKNVPGIREYDYTRLGRSDYEAYDRRSCDRPLPGAITHQMDVAAVKYLRKLEKLFVKEMTALIFKPRIKPWYELFLAFYVIFWNLEYIHHGAHDYIKSKNGTLIENQVSSVVSTQIRKWEFAFPVLLYHWRCILRGYSPFRLARDNPDELRDKGHIDQEGFAYVTRIAHLFNGSDADRFQPPITGVAAVHWSMANKWIVRLFKEAGA